MKHGKQNDDLAYEALRKLVAAEYPEGRELGEIAEVWGAEAGLTNQEIAALKTVEARLQTEP